MKIHIRTHRYMYVYIYIYVFLLILCSVMKPYWALWGGFVGVALGSSADGRCGGEALGTSQIESAVPDS